MGGELSKSEKIMVEELSAYPKMTRGEFSYMGLVWEENFPRWDLSGRGIFQDGTCLGGELSEYQVHTLIQATIYLLDLHNFLSVLYQITTAIRPCQG